MTRLGETHQTENPRDRMNFRTADSESARGGAAGEASDHRWGEVAWRERSLSGRNRTAAAARGRAVAAGSVMC